jgi:hypothetical protein
LRDNVRGRANGPSRSASPMNQRTPGQQRQLSPRPPEFGQNYDGVNVMPTRESVGNFLLNVFRNSSLGPAAAAGSEPQPGLEPSHRTRQWAVALWPRQPVDGTLLFSTPRIKKTVK